MHFGCSKQLVWSCLGIAFQSIWCITFPSKEARTSSPQFSESSCLLFWKMSVKFAFLQWSWTSIPHYSSFAEKWPQFGRLRFTWTDYGSGESGEYYCSMANERLLPKDWPLCRLSCFHPHLFCCSRCQRILFQVQGSCHIPQLLLQGLQEKNHEIMINIQFSLNRRLKKHAKAFFCAFKYNTENQGLQNIHCSIKKQR